MRELSNNWINKVSKTYQGNIRDIPKDIRIAYTDDKDFRVTTLVPPDKAEEKFNSLLERDSKPVRLP